MIYRRYKLGDIVGAGFDNLITLGWPPGPSSICIVVQDNQWLKSKRRTYGATVADNAMTGIPGRNGRIDPRFGQRSLNICPPGMGQMDFISHNANNAATVERSSLSQQITKKKYHHYLRGVVNRNRYSFDFSVLPFHKEGHTSLQT
jgi:hypothetical protein